DHGYLFPTVDDTTGYGIGGSNTFFGFTAFASRGTTGSANRTEQILQVVAGVRQDYADFDVHVIWDDRGVNSPFYDSRGTLGMVVGEDGGGGLFGIASSVDLIQSNRDVALAFEPAHIGLFPDTAYRSIRELIDTISHEAGHTFGLSHSTSADPQRR